MTTPEQRLVETREKWRKREDSQRHAKLIMHAPAALNLNDNVFLFCLPSLVYKGRVHKQKLYILVVISEVLDYH